MCLKPSLLVRTEQTSFVETLKRLHTNWAADVCYMTGIITTTLKLKTGLRSLFVSFCNFTNKVHQIPAAAWHPHFSTLVCELLIYTGYTSEMSLSLWLYWSMLLHTFLICWHYEITHSVDLYPNDLCVWVRAAGATSSQSAVDFLSPSLHCLFLSSCVLLLLKPWYIDKEVWWENSSRSSSDKQAGQLWKQVVTTHI